MSGKVVTRIATGNECLVFLFIFYFKNESDFKFNIPNNSTQNKLYSSRMAKQ